jgi:hypothetical protein
VTSLLVFFFALIVHESGHIWAALALGCSVTGLTWKWYGFGIKRSPHAKRIGNAVISAAGPLASLVGVLASCYLGFVTKNDFWYTAALAHLTLFVIGSGMDFWNIVSRRVR